MSGTKTRLVTPLLKMWDSLQGNSLVIDKLGNLYLPISLFLPPQ